MKEFFEKGNPKDGSHLDRREFARVLSGAVVAAVTATKESSVVPEKLTLKEKEQKVKKLFGNNLDLKKLKNAKRTPETKETKKIKTADMPYFWGVIPAEVVSEILQKTLPRGWVNNEVEETIVHNTFPPEKFLNKYRNSAVPTIDKARAINEKRYKQGKKDIIHWFPGENQADQVIHIFLHELGHANDWESDDDSTYEERLDLLLGVYERLISEDRYRSNYVEIIRDKDIQKQNYIKVLEYWAEICVQYFSAVNFNVKDFKLIDTHVRKTDPDFDLREAQKLREELLKKVSRG